MNIYIYDCFRPDWFLKVRVSNFEKNIFQILKVAINETSTLHKTIMYLVSAWNIIWMTNNKAKLKITVTVDSWISKLLLVHTYLALDNINTVIVTLAVPMFAE